MATVTPNVSKILMIRHAEKPTGGLDGVNLDGSPNEEALIVAGWQRSGALLALFRPARGPLQSPELATPDTIIASRTSPTKGSQRPYQTVAALAELLGLDDRHWLQFAKGDNKGAVEAALSAKGTVLISWQHEEIPSLVEEVAKKTGLPVDPTPPGHWPDARFDLVWVLDRVGDPPASWAFAQVPQMLMPGDSPEPIGGGR